MIACSPSSTCSPAEPCSHGRTGGTCEVNYTSIQIKGEMANVANFSFPCLSLQEWFSDDCKFRERFQENSYNTYASVIHRNHRTGREWYVALNKRGKAKMGSSPRVKSQHVSTHFLPRISLHDRSEHGFTIAEQRGQEGRKGSPPPLPPPPQAAAGRANIHAGTAPKRTQVKYWPKYRFG